MAIVSARLLSRFFSFSPLYPLFVQLCFHLRCFLSFLLLGRDISIIIVVYLCVVILNVLPLSLIQMWNLASFSIILTAGFLPVHCVLVFSLLCFYFSSFSPLPHCFWHAPSFAFVLLFLFFFSSLMKRHLGRRRSTIKLRWLTCVNLLGMMKATSAVQSF